VEKQITLFPNVIKLREKNKSPRSPLQKRGAKLEYGGGN